MLTSMTTDSKPGKRGMAGRDQLSLRLVGGFAVHRAGAVVPEAAVGSRKARTLLALLAVRPYHVVSVDCATDVLWNGTPPRIPAANVATLVSRLRNAFGPEVVLGGRRGYRLGDVACVDLEHAARLIVRAEARLGSAEPEGAQSVATRALKLLDGGAVVLPDYPDARWAEPARIRHTGLLRHARHLAAAAALRAGHGAIAAAVAEAAARADPLDEAACRILMRAYDATGEPARALVQFERLRAVLAHELGVDPAPATRELHIGILRRNAVAMPGAGRRTAARRSIQRASTTIVHAVSNADEPAPENRGEVVKRPARDV
jgi:DNA-binding SARP family transcriptional activator